MRNPGCFLLLVCLFLCIFAARAQDAAPLAAVPANFQFAGVWNCEGAFHNHQVHKSSFTGAVILAGKWIELTEQDIQPATGYVAEYLIGYDAQQKKLVEFDANNFSAASYSSEEGWRDGALTMTSPLAQDAKAPYALNRFVYTIAGPDSFTVDWQISRTPVPEWVQSDHLACKRRVGA